MSIETSVARVAGHIQNQTDLIQQVKTALTETEENIGRTNTEISTQSDIIQQIKTALEGKAAGGGVELPTLENEGSAEDLAQGKQLIGADGSVVTGNVRTITDSTGFMGQAVRYDEDGNAVGIPYAFDSSHLFKKDSGVTLWAYCDNFGNATSDQVAKGATFTSASGLLVEGTHECSEGVTLPTLTNPATSDDLVWGKELIDANGNKISGTMDRMDDVMPKLSYRIENKKFIASLDSKARYYDEAGVRNIWKEASFLGGAKPSDVREGVTFTSENGISMVGEALIPGGGFVYPDGAFMPVTSFTDGKQYALVAVIDGVRRYINTTTYNDYTMNATQVTIGEDAGDYVIFSNTPVLFTAVASGDGFLLQNGSNYLHGTSSGGTALRVGTTQMVWTVNTSATGGFSDGKYYAKEDPNSVWLMNSSSGYNWSIKYETAGSFGYDREGRDNTYSTGFVSFVLYEYVAGEGELNPVVDSSDANVTADKMLAGYSGYANGRKVEGNIQSRGEQTITPSTTAQEIPAGVYLAGKQTISAIQTETKSVTENGTYTPSSGKYFSSFTVNVPSGGTSSSGLVVKSGTTTSATIDTGLSEIEEFFIYKESQTATGLIRLHYSKTGGTSYMYASAWSTNNYGTKTITNATTAPTISGGSITLPSSTATSGGLSSGVTYKWTAIGKE